MTNIYGAYCLLSIDHDKKQNLIISTSKEKIEFPILPVENPRFLHNELRYNIQNFLIKNTYQIELIKSIKFSYIDIQNELILRYIESNYGEPYNMDKDVFVFCSTILEKPYPLKSELNWYAFEFNKSLVNMDLTTSIIDFTIQQSIL